LSGCIWLKLFNEGASDKLQLTLFGATVQITRGILSRCLGWSMDIYTIIAAAAPLDYILRKGSASWRLVGVGVCSKQHATEVVQDFTRMLVTDMARVRSRISR
jgi:hypothetical protein